MAVPLQALAGQGLESSKPPGGAGSWPKPDNSVRNTGIVTGRLGTARAAAGCLGSESPVSLRVITSPGYYSHSDHDYDATVPPFGTLVPYDIIV
jgi:hypothetical protein